MKHIPALLILAGFLTACAGTATISGSSVKGVRTDAGSSYAPVSGGSNSASGISDLTGVNATIQKRTDRSVAPASAPAPAPRVQVRPGGGDSCSGGAGLGKAQPMCLVE
jgi:hypothetical protein